MSNNFKDISDEEWLELLSPKEAKKVTVEKVDSEVVKFQEVIDFINENNREPLKTAEWTQERALWARLKGFREKPDRNQKVKAYDTLGILEIDPCIIDDNRLDEENIEDILLQGDEDNNLFDLLDVSRYKRTINAADNIGRRKNAKNFDKYQHLFDEVHADIASGKRNIVSFEQYDIEVGRFYIQNGIMMYIVAIGNFYTDNKGEKNAEMHVVYENGTENKKLLFRSLASSLYAKKRHGRMVTDIIDDNQLLKKFGEEFTTGYIYVIKSLSNDQQISNLKNLYKIGFTSKTVVERIRNAENELTYLNAPVQIVLTAEIKNVDAQKLERTLHHIFQDKQVVFEDNNYKKATEWYVVPIDEIEMKINQIIADLQK